MMLATTSLRFAVTGLRSRAAALRSEVLAELPEPERLVQSLYYEHERQLAAVGQGPDFSRAKAGALGRRAIRRLQEGLRQRLPALGGARAS
jgi:DNA-directed RNA polymerase specialized sigma subunit